MNEPPTFTRTQLTELARMPAERLEAAVPDGATAYRQCFDETERYLRRGRRGFAAWEQETLHFLIEVLPTVSSVTDATVQLLATETAWLIGGLNEVTPEDLVLTSSRRGAEITRLEEADGTVAAHERALRIVEAYRRLHDAHRDAISACWGKVLEIGGRDALEQCLRKVASGSLMPWMERDVTASPRDRLLEWTAVMTANFSRIHVDELDDRYRIVQDPCGSCTRQVQDARCDPPLSLPLVAPFAPESGVDPVPVYRSHIGLMHWLMPIERSGRPWPVVRCPTGTGAGPCVLAILKDPDAAP